MRALESIGWGMAFLALWTLAAGCLVAGISLLVTGHWVLGWIPLAPWVLVIAYLIGEEM